MAAYAPIQRPVVFETGYTPVTNWLAGSNAVVEVGCFVRSRLSNNGHTHYIIDVVYFERVLTHPEVELREEKCFLEREKKDYRPSESLAFGSNVRISHVAERCRSEERPETARPPRPGGKGPYHGVKGALKGSYW